MSSPSERDQQVSAARLSFPHRMSHLIQVCGGVAEIAGRTSITRTKIYEWTYFYPGGAVRIPNGTSLLSLAIATGVDLNWLLLGKGTPPTPDNTLRDHASSAL